MAKADRIYQTFLTPHSQLQISVPQVVLRKAQVTFAAGHRLQCLSNVAQHIPSVLQPLYTAFTKTREFQHCKSILIKVAQGKDVENSHDRAWKKELDTAVANLIRVFLRKYDNARSESLVKDMSGDALYQTFGTMWKTVQLMCWAVLGYRRKLPGNILNMSTSLSPRSPFASRGDSLSRSAF
jgi:hypothetical protein